MSVPQEAKVPETKTMLQRQIDATDKEIDRHLIQYIMLLRKLVQPLAFVASGQMIYGLRVS